VPEQGVLQSGPEGDQRNKIHCCLNTVGMTKAPRETYPCQWFGDKPKLFAKDYQLFYLCYAAFQYLRQRSPHSRLKQNRARLIFET
jgi:hypothetical protein